MSASFRGCAVKVTIANWSSEHQGNAYRQTNRETDRQTEVGAEHDCMIT